MTENQTHYIFSKEEITPELLKTLLYHTIEYGFYFYSYDNHLTFRTAKLENLDNIGTQYNTYCLTSNIEEIRVAKESTSTHYRIAHVDSVVSSYQMFCSDIFSTPEDAIERAKKDKETGCGTQGENKIYWQNKTHVVQEVTTKVKDIFHI